MTERGQMVRTAQAAANRLGCPTYLYLDCFGNYAYTLLRGWPDQIFQTMQPEKRDD